MLWWLLFLCASNSQTAPREGREGHVVIQYIGPWQQHQHQHVCGIIVVIFVQITYFETVKQKLPMNFISLLCIEETQTTFHVSGVR